MDKNIVESIKGILCLSDTEVEKNCKELSEMNACYFWASNRGGNAVMINEDGERLIANSAVRFEDHVKAFKSGRRN
jgi:protein associated with RNAse G/E